MNSFFLVILKPDAIRRKLVGQIIHQFEKRDFDIVNIRQFDEPDCSLITELYSQHKSNSYFDDLIKFMVSGPIVLMVLSGDINVAKKLSSDIREKYSNNILKNVIHCSHDEVSGKQEVRLWFPYFDVKLHV